MVILYLSWSIDRFRNAGLMLTGGLFLKYVFHLVCQPLETAATLTPAFSVSSPGSKGKIEPAVPTALLWWGRRVHVQTASRVRSDACPAVRVHAVRRAERGHQSQRPAAGALHTAGSNCTMRLLAEKVIVSFTVSSYTEGT